MLVKINFFTIRVIMTLPLSIPKFFDNIEPLYRVILGFFKIKPRP